MSSTAFSLSIAPNICTYSSMYNQALFNHLTVNALTWGLLLYTCRTEVAILWLLTTHTNGLWVFIIWWYSIGGKSWTKQILWPIYFDLLAIGYSDRNAWKFYGECVLREQIIFVVSFYTHHHCQYLWLVTRSLLMKWRNGFGFPPPSVSCVVYVQNMP